MDAITEESRGDARGAVAGSSPLQWLERYRAIRKESERLCAPLAIEDYVVQSRAEVSPPKWHLAHTTWFFEQFLFQPFLRGYRLFNPRFEQLFNSYYLTVGEPFPRSMRGTLSRPTVEEIYRFRAYVDAAMEDLLLFVSDERCDEVVQRVALGLHHEQQHQELLLMDIKHNFASNPLQPSYHLAIREKPSATLDLRWRAFDGGVVEIGARAGQFSFDNEQPRHETLLQPFAIASRLVTNGEFLAFMEDGGYARSEWWLSDGWSRREQERWRAPLYWRGGDGEWEEATLAGMQPLDLHAPVGHISYYEADAYARWAGKRLPGEAEWEHAASGLSVEGNLLESGHLHPRAAPAGELTQMIGDLWEWTRSSYVAYPGYRRAEGPLGEYNGKFMCNQMVLRGGCCVTPASHLRVTYRNFYFPWDRWQFSGIRLVEDA